MSSFVGSQPPRRAEWSVDDAARFAALKDRCSRQPRLQSSPSPACAAAGAVHAGRIRGRPTSGVRWLDGRPAASMCVASRGLVAAQWPS
eukprot:1326694-Prymnesium_polylepis.1